MPSVQAFCGAGASFNDGGTTAWSNPTNIQGDTTSTAATCNVGSNGGTSYKLRASNFGFNIPASATILGISVEIERAAANSNRHYENNIQLLKAGSESGTNKSTGAAIPTTKAFITYGANNDLWGNTLTPSDVNNSGFGVSFKITRTSSQTTTTSVYRVRITVTYSDTQNINVNQVSESESAQVVTPQKGILIGQVPQLSVSDNAGTDGVNFDDGTIGTWETEIGNYSPLEFIDVSTEQIHKGNYSLKIVDDNGNNSGVTLKKAYPTGYGTDTWTRFYFYFPSAGISNGLLSNGYNKLFYVNPMGVVGLYNDASGTPVGWWLDDGYFFEDTPSSGVTYQGGVLFDTWICVEIRTVYNNPNSGCELWINGTKILEKKTNTFPFQPNVYYIANESGNFLGGNTASLTLYYDSLRFGASQIGLYPQAFTDEALSIDVRKIINVAQVIETELTEVVTVDQQGNSQNINVAESLESSIAQDIAKQKFKSVSNSVENNTAQFLTINKIIVVSQSLSTDSSQSIYLYRIKKINVTAANESNIVNSVTRVKQKNILQSLAINSAQSLSGLKSKAVDQVNETSTSQIISSEINYNIPVELSAETDLAQAVIKIKSKIINSAGLVDGYQQLLDSAGLPVYDANNEPILVLTDGAQNEFAQSINAVKRIDLNPAVETETAFIISSELNVQTVSETDIAQVINAKKLINVIQISESESAQLIGKIGLTILDQTIEINSANQIKAVKYIVINTAVENHSVNSINKLKQKTLLQSSEIEEAASFNLSGKIAQCTESDTSLVIRPTRVYTISYANESESLTAIKVSKNKSIIQLTEIDLCGGITKKKYKQLQEISETDFAINLNAILKKINIAPVSEVEFATSIYNGGTKLINLTQVFEIDKSITVRRFDSANLKRNNIRVTINDDGIMVVIYDYSPVANPEEFNLKCEIIETSK